ncbi:MAG: peptide deformylase [Minisyncoccia bacterium]
MIKPIVQNPHPALRTQSEKIPVADITSSEIQTIIADMQDSLATQNDGVALAAPQIGITKQIFVVAPFLFDQPEHAPLVYINPIITNQSKKTKWKHEGCLSCRWQVGEVDRHLETTITAHDEHGNEFTETAGGLLAHIFQHETDHLHGILFIDKARKLREMTAEEIAEVEGDRK